MMTMTGVSTLDRNIVVVTDARVLATLRARPTSLNELGQDLGSLNSFSGSFLVSGTGLVIVSWQKHSAMRLDRIAPQLAQSTKGKCLESPDTG